MGKGVCQHAYRRQCVAAMVCYMVVSVPAQCVKSNYKAYAVGGIGSACWALGKR